MHTVWAIYHAYSVLLNLHHRIYCYNLRCPHPPFRYGFARLFHFWALARMHGHPFRVMAWYDATSSQQQNLQIWVHRINLHGLYGAFIHFGHKLIYRIKV